MDASEFLNRVRANAARDGAGKLVDVTLAGLIFAQAQPTMALDGLKLIAQTYGKATVRATIRAGLDALLEE